MAFSSQQPKESLELFADLSMPQQQQQQQEATDNAADSGAGSKLPAAAPVGEVEAAAETATTNAAGSDGAADGAGQTSGVLPLKDICSIQECWGVLCMDLCNGEAVMHEEGGCRLQLGPGESPCSVTDVVHWYIASGLMLCCGNRLRWDVCNKCENSHAFACWYFRPVLLDYNGESEVHHACTRALTGATIFN